MNISYVSIKTGNVIYFKYQGLRFLQLTKIVSRIKIANTDVQKCNL